MQRNIVKAKHPLSHRNDVCNHGTRVSKNKSQKHATTICAYLQPLHESTLHTSPSRLCKASPRQVRPRMACNGTASKHPETNLNLSQGNSSPLKLGLSRSLELSNTSNGCSIHLYSQAKPNVRLPLQSKKLDARLVFLDAKERELHRRGLASQRGDV